MLKGCQSDWGWWGLALEDFIGDIEQGFEGREWGVRRRIIRLNLIDKYKTVCMRGRS